MKKLREILITILPFLFSAAERFWEALPDKSKDALIEAAQISQILKEGYKQGYDAFMNELAQRFGFTREQTDDILTALAKKLAIDINAPNELFDKLQAKIDAGMEDSTWDNLWHSITGQLQIIRTEGRMNWGQLAMGVIQFVYDKFIKK